MKVKLFSLKKYEENYMLQANAGLHDLYFEPEALSPDNASSCKGFQAVSVFTNDHLSAPVLNTLKETGVRYVAIRATGYDHADLGEAKRLGIRIANVPEYSPYSVAELVITHTLALNRKIALAQEQVHQYNFSLNNLIGFDLHQKTIGILGMGRIGGTVAKILHGFGCKILAFDQVPNPSFIRDYNVRYCSKEELFSNADIITLHIPLNEHTRYIINKESISTMKDGVMIVNTGRGGLIDTEAAIEGLKSGRIGSLGLDVYEKEKGIFFYDHSGKVIQDDTLLKLMSFKNVLITPHMGFLTSTALQDIADTTFYTLKCWDKGEHSRYELY